MSKPLSACPYANFVDPDTYANGTPRQAFFDAAKTGPLQQLEDPITSVPYWLVSGRDEADYIAKHPLLFSSAERTVFIEEYPQEEIDAIHSNLTINMDPPRHLRYRKLVRNVFTPKSVASYEASFKQHAKNIIDAVAEKGQCEFVEDIAAELPLFAILELCGIDPEDRKDFFRWTNIMSFADDPDMSEGQEQAMEASMEVIAYAQGIAQRYKENPEQCDSPIVASLMAGVEGEHGMTEEEFCWFMLMLISAGNESTRTVTSHGMRLLMEHPQQLQYLLDHPDQLPAAIEEILRYNTAFIQMRRTATEDVDLAGQQIKKGDKVMLNWYAINLDTKVFGDDAYDFNIRRVDAMPDLHNQHRSFGVGQHFCIGAHLARMELNIIFSEMLPRLSNPQFAGKVEYTRNNLIHGIKKMPISFTPERV